jgi:hypothetical protein
MLMVGRRHYQQLPAALSDTSNCPASTGAVADASQAVQGPCGSCIVHAQPASPQDGFAILCGDASTILMGLAEAVSFNRLKNEK